MELLEQAVARHRAGDLAGAEALYRQVLEAEPASVEANQLLALVVRRRDPVAALAHLDRALEGDPEHGPAWSNRALVLLTLRRPAEAEASAARALQLRPDLAEARLTLARLRLSRGAVDDAAAIAAPLVDRPEGRHLLGVVALARGDGPEAHRLLDALVSRGVLPLPPDHAASLGGLLVAAGRAADGARWLGRALRAAPRPGWWIAWADALMQASEPPVDDRDLLLQALARPDLDVQRLERAARLALEADPAVAAWLDDPVAELPDHPLLRPWLRSVVVQSPRWERRLASLRRALYDAVQAGEPVDLELLEALAVQCWYGEHAWPDALDPAPPPPEDPARVAAYALFADPTGVGEGPWTAALPHLARLTVEAARIEAAVELPTLGLTDDPVSVAVRDQYEANPYPRLVAIHRREPRPLREVLAGLGIRAEVPHGPVDVLVAGCGTGQHPLTTATSWAGARVLAVDLSRRSLRVAARRARELGLADRIELAQADLLALGGLDRTFDVVESVGVLHHLADPLAGWRVLRDRVRPGGLMRIGLYSERGRAEVVAARAVVEEAGLAPTPDGLRVARRLLMALPADHPAAPIVHSPDFYSLSGLRDLVFHVCEHRFTLPAVARALDALGLRFLGFQHVRADAPHRFRARFGDADAADLERWAALEDEDPALFRGMYVLWCQR